MLYRLVLGVLVVIAVTLTLNERRQEQRAHDLAERTNQIPGSAFLPPPPGPMPTPVAGSAASRLFLGPFLPHRVRVRRDIDLLDVPEPTGRRVLPVSAVPAGVLAQAVDERNGWYLIDTNMNRGWAPMDLFDEP